MKAEWINSSPFPQFWFTSISKNYKTCLTSCEQVLPKLWQILRALYLKCQSWKMLLLTYGLWFILDNGALSDECFCLNKHFSHHSNEFFLVRVESTNYLFGLQFHTGLFVFENKLLLQNSKWICSESYQIADHTSQKTNVVISPAFRSG